MLEKKKKIIKKKKEKISVDFNETNFEEILSVIY